MESDGLICPEKEEEIWEVIDQLEGAEKGRAYFELSNFAYARGQFHRSLSLAEMARDLFIELQQCFEGLAHSQSSMAYSCFALKDMDRAIDEMKIAVKYFEEYAVSGELDRRRCLINWLQEQGRFEESFEYIEENLKHVIYEDQVFDACLEYNKYAFGLAQVHKEEKAIEYYKIAREKFKELKDVERVADADFSIGRCYNRSNNPLDAEIYLSRALQVYEAANLFDDIARTRAQLGRSALLQNRFEEALGHFEASRKIILGEDDIDYRALFSVQKNMIKAMRGVGWDVEAKVIERRNAVINEVLELDTADA
jgi:tetratricopeptide (TPR) repeat protein